MVERTSPPPHLPDEQPEDVLLAAPDSPFERIKHADHGHEYWSARELAKTLGYTEYRKFLGAIRAAEQACETSGHKVSAHFEPTTVSVQIGSGAHRQVADVRLSRYACYLVVQNADPAKQTVALGQTYLSAQAHRQERADRHDPNVAMAEDQRRLLLRQEIKRQNTDLSRAARRAGVVKPEDFSAFQNHGYMGLYNGLNAQDIHERKGLRKNQHILDHMGRVELAANLFRATQAEEKLRRDNIRDKDAAIRTHEEAGQIVREAIEKMGGAMPEDLPPAESIKNLERRHNQRLSPPKPKAASKKKGT